MKNVTIPDFVIPKCPFDAMFGLTTRKVSLLEPNTAYRRL